MIFLTSPRSSHLLVEDKWYGANVSTLWIGIYKNEVRLANFYSLKAHCFRLGITCYFLATRVERLPGAAGVWTPDPQILSLPWQVEGSGFNTRVLDAKILKLMPPLLSHWKHLKYCLTFSFQTFWHLFTQMVVDLSQRAPSCTLKGNTWQYKGNIQILLLSYT